MIIYLTEHSKPYLIENHQQLSRVSMWLIHRSDSRTGIANYYFIMPYHNFTTTNSPPFNSSNRVQIYLVSFIYRLALLPPSFLDCSPPRHTRTYRASHSPKNYDFFKILPSISEPHWPQSSTSLRSRMSLAQMRRRNHSSKICGLKARQQSALAEVTFMILWWGRAGSNLAFTLVIVLMASRPSLKGVIIMRATGFQDLPSSDAQPSAVRIASQPLIASFYRSPTCTTSPRKTTSSITTGSPDSASYYQSTSRPSTASMRGGGGGGTWYSL